MGMSSLQLTTAALSNLFDSEEDAKNAAIVAEGLVPEPQVPQPKSNLRLVFESLVPGLAAGGAAALRNVAFGGRRGRRRGQGFGQTFLQGLLAGAPPALLQSIERRRTEQQGFETAQRQRQSDVLKAALEVGEAARGARPSTFEQAALRATDLEGLTPEQIQALGRDPLLRQVTGEGGEEFAVDLRGGLARPLMRRGTTPRLGAPSIIGPLFREEGIPVPLRLRQPPPSILRGPRGEFLERDPVTGKLTTVRPGEKRRPKKLTLADRKEKVQEQASIALGEILNMPSVNQNPQAAADIIRSNRRLSPAQKNILLDLLEKQFRPRRGIDPKEGRGGQNAEKRARSIIGQ